jgi:hypothetical protein
MSGANLMLLENKNHKNHDSHKNNHDPRGTHRRGGKHGHAAQRASGGFKGAPIISRTSRSFTGEQRGLVPI